MTLVTIDLGDVAGGHHPDDYVTIRAEAFRESQGGGITSTAEVTIPLVNGVGQAEVEPGPVVVSFRCKAVADTREKRGVVPSSGTVGIEDVIAGAFEYTPPVVNLGLDLIEDARDGALGQVEDARDGALGQVEDMVAGLDLIEASDPRVPAIIQGPTYALTITDGNYAAFAITTDGDVVIPRVDDTTRDMFLDRTGLTDTLVRGADGLDFYPWRVSDADGVSPLAVRYDGAVDFRILTSQALEYLSGAATLPDGGDPTPPATPEAPAPIAWVPDTTTTGLHATRVDTGQRVHLSPTATQAQVLGDAVTWQDEDQSLYLRTPGDGPWRAADTTRMSFWGSSSVEEAHPYFTTMMADFGVTDVRLGGVGSDLARHILGRMGAQPWVLTSDIIIPETGDVEFNATSGAASSRAGDFLTPGTLAGIHGHVDHRGGARYRFIRETPGTAVTVPEGTAFISDWEAYRDAPALIQLGKNDLNNAAAPGEDILAHSELVYQWLRTLPEWVVVLGHHLNSDWAADSGRAQRTRKANDLCRERFGNRFIDLNAYLCSPQVWEHTGFTPTAQDLVQQGEGIMPITLARDNGMHLNPTANQAYIEHLVKPRLQNLGWFH